MVKKSLERRKGYGTVVADHLHVHANLAAGEERALDHVLQKLLHHVVLIHQVVVYVARPSSPYSPFPPYM